METLKQTIEARQKEAQRQPDDTLVWLIAGGMLLRALLAVVTEPYAYDQNCFFSWALKIAQDGPGNFYAPDYFADYPPGYMLVLGLVGKLMGLLHLNFTQAAAWLLMSLVPILCAGGLVWAVWNIGLEAWNGDVRWANRAAGFAAFGPSLVYCTGVWMQIDEVVCFLMVLALWQLSRGQFWQGCLWYGAALAVKPQALLAGPVLLEKKLAEPAVRAFLTGYGYEDFSIESALGTLARHMICGESFPHEIGVFLDYPLADVAAFIENEGRNCRCVGCWKAYSNIDEARRLFALYRKCRDVYMACYQRGFGVARLTVAA